ncbi:MAG: hypothetical protein AB7I48_02560 [Planctomycetaceae bacterium]
MNDVLTDFISDGVALSSLRLPAESVGDLFLGVRGYRVISCIHCVMTIKQFSSRELSAKEFPDTGPTTREL